MSSHVDDSGRVIRNRAIWMASDWFQYGSTKPDNRAKCQSNQSSELSSQQPIRSVLIKLEEEKEREAPSVLRWHGPAWQCAIWIFCGPSVKSGCGVNSYRECAQRSSIKWLTVQGVLFNPFLMCFHHSCTSGLIWKWCYSMICKADKLVK